MPIVRWEGLMAWHKIQGVLAMSLPSCDGMSASHLLRLFIPCGTHYSHLSRSVSGEGSLRGSSRERGCSSRAPPLRGSRSAAALPGRGPASPRTLTGPRRASEPRALHPWQPARLWFSSGTRSATAPPALADARKTFCKAGKFPVVTRCLTGVRRQLQTESSQGA